MNDGAFTPESQAFSKEIDAALRPILEKTLAEYDRSDVEYVASNTLTYLVSIIKLTEGVKKFERKQDENRNVQNEPVTNARDKRSARAKRV